MEVPLSSMLAARMESVIAAGLGKDLLEACTSWILHSGSSKRSDLLDRSSILLAVNCIDYFRCALLFLALRRVLSDCCVLKEAEASVGPGCFSACGTHKIRTLLFCTSL